MTFSSFIFYISQEYNPCGCNWDCSCETYSSYNCDFTNSNDAAAYIADRVKRGKMEYVNTIYVNGLRINYMGYSRKFDPIHTKRDGIHFHNPINVSDFEDYFDNKLLKEPSLPVGAAEAALQTLHDLYEKARPLVEEHIRIKNAEMEAKTKANEEAQRKKELEELKRLRDLYPDD